MAWRASIHPRKLKGFKDEAQRLTLDESLAVARELGPEAVNAILATIGYGGAHPLGDAPSLDEMGTHLTKSAAAIFHARCDDSDGGPVVTHREKAGLRSWLLSTGTRCFAVAAQLGREIGS